jgi:superfamily II DNA or RNA helicase
MRINRQTIWTYVTEASNTELDDLTSALTFETDMKTLTLFDAIEGRFYSGLIPILEDHGFHFEVDSDEQAPTLDLSEIVVDETILEGCVLRDYQTAAIRKALYHGRGIFQLPTGAGKTEVAAAIIQHMRAFDLGERAVALVPSVFLMQQMADRFEARGLGEVIRVGGSSKFPRRIRDRDTAIFVVNSAHRALQRDTPAANFIREADLLLLEEAHHTKADTWTDVARQCGARLRFALTATAFDKPGQWSYGDLALVGLSGKIICNVRSRELRTRGYLADPLVTMLRTASPQIRNWSWKTVYEYGIVENHIRNSMITSLAASVYEAGHKIMIFVGRKSHGHRLCRSLSMLGCDAVFVHGGSTAIQYLASGRYEQKTWRVADIAEFVNSREQCVLITTQVLDEGLDVPVINVLIMATGMEKYRRTIQRCGRGMRPKEGQNRVFVFDFYDDQHPFLKKHSEYRLWTYRTEEYDIAESLEQTMSSLDCPLTIMRDMVAVSLGDL